VALLPGSPSADSYSYSAPRYSYSYSYSAPRYSYSYSYSAPRYSYSITPQRFYHDAIVLAFLMIEYE
jgi:hypothetical protein